MGDPCITIALARRALARRDACGPGARASFIGALRDGLGSEDLHHYLGPRMTPPMAFGLAVAHLCDDDVCAEFLASLSCGAAKDVATMFRTRSLGVCLAVNPPLSHHTSLYLDALVPVARGPRDLKRWRKANPSFDRGGLYTLGQLWMVPSRGAKIAALMDVGADMFAVWDARGGAREYSPRWCPWERARRHGDLEALWALTPFHPLVVVFLLRVPQRVQCRTFVMTGVCDRVR